MINLQRRLIALTALLALAGSSLPATSLAGPRANSMRAKNSRPTALQPTGPQPGEKAAPSFTSRRGCKPASSVEASRRQRQAKAPAPRKTLVSAQAADVGLRVFVLAISGALATGLALTANVAFNTDSPYVGGVLAVTSVAVAIGAWLGIGRDTFRPAAAS